MRLAKMLRRLRALLQRNEEPVQDETLVLCRMLDAAVEATAARFSALLPWAPRYAKWAAHSDQPPELPAWLVATVDTLERVQDAALEPVLRSHPRLAHEMVKLLRRVEHEYLHVKQETFLLTQLRQVSLALLSGRDERARLSEDLMVLVRDELNAESSRATACEQLGRFEKLAVQHVSAEGACITTLIRAPFLVCASVNQPDVPWASLTEAMLNAVPNSLRKRVAQLRALLDANDTDRLFNELADAQVSEARAAPATLAEARRRLADNKEVVLREQAVEIVRQPNRNLVMQCEQLRHWFRKAEVGHMLEIEWVVRTPALLLAPASAQKRLQDTMPSHLQLARTEVMRVQQRLPQREQMKLEQQFVVR